MKNYSKSYICPDRGKTWTCVSPAIVAKANRSSMGSRPAVYGLGVVCPWDGLWIAFFGWLALNLHRRTHDGVR